MNEKEKDLNSMTTQELDVIYMREIGHLAWHRTHDSYVEAIRCKRDLIPEKPCEKHKKSLDYVSQIEKNESYSRKGKKQIQCPDCKRYYWSDEF